MKLSSPVILIFILVLLVPVWFFIIFLKKKIRPSESLARLFIYFLAGFILVFAFTFVFVLLYRKLYPAAF